MKRLYLSLLAGGIFALGMVSCSEDTMDTVNKDENHTTTAPAKYIMADVLTSTAFYNVGGDLNTYTSIYVEHEAGVDNQLLRAEMRNGEPSMASTFNNTWGNIYKTLLNCKLVVSKSYENNDRMARAAGQVMGAYNWALLTDMFGDVPFTEALNINNLQPKLDSQESIYKAVNDSLDAAIAILETSPSNTLGSYDFVYGGSAESWLKFAYGLKARYTMRLLARSANKNADLEKVLEYAGKSFTSSDEQAAFNVYDANNLNPLFDFEWSRDGLSGRLSAFKKLTERNDPRADRIYFDSYYWNHYSAADFTAADSELELFENGVSEGIKYYYPYTVYMYSQLASTLLLSYHEILFLKAEALCRLGRANEAEPILKEAIEVAFANTEASVVAAMNAPSVLQYGGLDDITDGALSDADADQYFDTSVKPLFDANPLKEVMNQKYLAFWGASGESTETYNDIRRMKALGEDFVKLANPKKFPLRCPYGSDDVLANPNVNAAQGDGQYVYTENVWWAGGSR